MVCYVGGTNYFLNTVLTFRIVLAFSIGILGLMQLVHSALIEWWNWISWRLKAEVYWRWIDVVYLIRCIVHHHHCHDHAMMHHHNLKRQFYWMKWSAGWWAISFVLAENISTVWQNITNQNWHKTPKLFAIIQRLVSLYICFFGSEYYYIF